MKPAQQLQADSELTAPAAGRSLSEKARLGLHYSLNVYIRLQPILDCELRPGSLGLPCQCVLNLRARPTAQEDVGLDVEPLTHGLTCCPTCYRVNCLPKMRVKGQPPSTFESDLIWK